MPTGGSPLTVFNDFMSTTGPAVLTGPDSFINEASKRNYMLSRFLGEDEMGEMIQGGDEIIDFILKEDASTFTDYQPNAMHTWQNPQVMTNWKVPWRFSLDHMSWTQQEVLLQMGSGLTRKARFHKYKSIKRKIEARMWTSMMNGMEDALVAVPDKDEMEASAGKTPYSLIAFNNEETNGLFTDGSETWTTVQQLDPTTDTYWVPQQVQYNYNDPYDTNKNKDGVIDAFEEIAVDLDFRPPPKAQEYFEGGPSNTNTGPNPFLQKFIATSKGGILLYKRALREIGDRGYVSNPQDPAYMRPQFAGFDVEEFDTLEAAALYDDGSSGRTDWANATTPGPRYYFFHTRYIRMIFHSERYFFKHEVDSHPNQVGSYRQPVEVWRNLVCRSRRRGCGIVYPGGAGSA